MNETEDKSRRPIHPEITHHAPPPPPPSGKDQTSWVKKFFLSVLVLVLVISLFYNAIQFAVISIYAGSDITMEVLKQGKSNEIVAVYELQGAIDGSCKKRFESFYRTIVNDKNVRAVVLRVNSPGGTVSDSTEIHHMIGKIRDSGKKVVVSMGGVTASGGYMISAPADIIYAQPSTITGSIGVIAMVPNFYGTMEKLGLRITTIKSTHSEKWKDRLNPFKEKIEDDEIASLQETLDELQVHFENVVREGRGDNLDLEVQEPVDPEKNGEEVPVGFTGKTFMAAEAKEIGLVDKIGFVDDAISEAARLANLSDHKVIRYSENTGIMGSLMGAEAKAGSINIDAGLLDNLQAPRILMMWKVRVSPEK